MVLKLTIQVIAIVLAVVAHEWAHGFAAYKLGDHTAKDQGRLSLNPIKHFDIIGTFLVPMMLFLSQAGFIFGWAKPVPINFRNLKNYKRDILIVSAAGIVMNLILATLAALLLKLMPYLGTGIVQGIIGIFLFNFLIFNVILAVFNSLPIPPLDGSKILFGAINKPWAMKYISADRLGMLMIIFFAFILPSIHSSLNLIGIYINTLSKYLFSILF